jgi:peptide-methionine (R)-S-oxide reductase
MTRRIWGLGAVGAALGSIGLSRLFGRPAEAGETETYLVAFPDSEWKRRLTPEQYRILRGHGTEFAGTSPLNAEKRKGTFVCAGCDQPLFRSETKFESGTGWPSFYQPIAGAVGVSRDNALFMTRTEVQVRPLRRSSGTRFRRRSQAYRTALLHEWERHDIQADRSCHMKCCPARLQRHPPEGGWRPAQRAPSCLDQPLESATRTGLSR